MARALSPTEKLTKRIKKEFPKKKMLGDININDAEFELLIAYFRRKYNRLVSGGNRDITDPVFCVALVQIGIRYYDGAFWSHVKRILENPKFNSNHQVWIGSIFVETLRKYDKIQLSDSERVDSILMHGFISEKFADKFFDFLYAFYSIDLERDISRLNSDVINDLSAIVQKHDHTGRSYFLVEHTADAFRNNSRGAKLRVRRYLKLIDKAFWGDDLPGSSKNRIINYFLHWKDNSADLLNEKKQQGVSHRRGRKHFASPYIKYEPRANQFRIVIPSQIISVDDADDLYWIVEQDGNKDYIELNPFQCVTGYKTDELSYSISSKGLFSSYQFLLMSGKKRLRLFKINGDTIRLFDVDGDSVRIDSVQPGFLYSFTETDIEPLSEALIESEQMLGLLRSSFDLVNGDLIRLPDGNPISVGGKVHEGLLPRGCVASVICDRDGEKIPVYMQAPYVVVKTTSKRTAGTAIHVNEKVYRFTKNQKLVKGITEFELNKRTGEKGFLIDLCAFNVNKDGTYKIHVDIPNDRSNNRWEFSLINNLEYEFEDVPYIFHDRGTLSLPTFLKCSPESKDVDVETKDRIRYNFDIKAGEDYLFVDIEGMRIGFEIPALAYQFEGEEWHTGAHLDVWHSDFNTKLRIKYVADRIRIFLNDTGAEHADEHFEIFTKNKSKNVFECDLNRFKSWFGRDDIKRKMYIEVPGQKDSIFFLNIITKSVLRDGILRADYDKNLIIGQFDIAGYSSYYADIYYQGECICNKGLLNNGYIEIPSELRSGKYEVRVYESEEDDTGFGDDVYYEIGRKTVDLLNAGDLNGQSVWIDLIKPSDEDIFYLPLNYKYYIVNLQKKSPEDKHNYRGKMIVYDYKKQCVATFLVNVEFPDLEQLGIAHITFVDEEDELDFLYDASTKIIVKEEDPRLSKSQAYRRYKNILYRDEYIFCVQFFTPSKNLLALEVDDRKYNNTDINLKTQNTSFVFKWK